MTKMTKTQRELLASPHLCRYAREEIEEDPSRFALRRSRGGSVKVTDVEVGESVWFYRGFEIRLNESVSAGYYGRFTWGSWRKGGGAGSLGEAIDELDREVTR